MDVSMPDFPTPPPHSDASSTTSSSSSSTSSQVRSTVAGTAFSPPLFFSPCPLGPDYDQNGNKIKRPMNAFMVWAKMRRAQITAAYTADTQIHHSVISKTLGVEWREMSVADKQPYVEKAHELRAELFRKHPHYVYRPRKRTPRPAPYPMGPDHKEAAAPGAKREPASLPAGTPTPSSLIMGLPPPSSISSTSSYSPPLALVKQENGGELPTAPMGQAQLPLLLAPSLLTQLQQSSLLAAALHQQQQPGIMNPLLFANILNPLFTQMLTQFTPSVPPQ